MTSTATATQTGGLLRLAAEAVDLAQITSAGVDVHTYGDEVTVQAHNYRDADRIAVALLGEVYTASPTPSATPSTTSSAAAPSLAARRSSWSSSSTSR